MIVPHIILRIGGRLLRGLLPDRWRVPLEYFLHVLGRDCESELRYLEKIGGERKVAIDVGANYGYYTYKMTRLFAEVYAFEANPALAGVLRTLRRPGLHVVARGLSSSEGVSTLYVPLFGGHPQVGWGSLHPDQIPDPPGSLRVDVSLATLDSFKIRPVSLIKIDVEGHELEVLKGAERTLEECRPVVIVEVRERNAVEVGGFFERLGYAPARLEDLAGVRGSPQNTIYVPRDGAARATALLGS